MKSKILLLACLLSGSVAAENVYIYTWENQQGGQQATTQMFYVSERGLIMEQPSSSSEMVILQDGRMIMNDSRSGSSMILDPDNMPSISDLGGASSDDIAAANAQGGQAIQEAMRQYQEQMANLTPEQREAMSRLGNLGQQMQEQMAQAMAGQQQSGQQAAPSNPFAGLSALTGSGSSPAPAEFVETGNTGREDGMRWEEVQLTLGNTTTTYRVVDWSDVEGAELVSRHYDNMAEAIDSMMSNMGLGGMLQSMQTWPKDISTYLSENQKFPIYIDGQQGTQRLVDVTRGEIDDDRFGAQYPVRSMFGQ